ncbi:3-hydroxyacyl-CoA dehydrogenase family protein [Streptomyces canus]|uniref:3-hydroxyacyl-CoA dehydrogenase family protein n=1 Tax=Streptomyces canus TaxID=58343 RepID=UPI002E2BBCF8|nr:3-hydroxyacyl-CoA dehydrogenase family protein [Streptomyces canus]
MTDHTVPTAVVGLGAVGEPLLRMLYRAGHQVIGLDRDPQVLARVERRLKEQDTAPSGRGPGPDTVLLTDDMTALGRAGAVFEAVTEDWDVKSEALRAIGRHCPPDAVVLTVSAELPVSGLALASGRPRHTVGLRLFQPPQPDGSAVCVPTTMTLEASTVAAGDLVSRLGLRQVPVTTASARAATTLVHGLLNGAVALHEEGFASRDSIDAAMRLGCGLPVGPLALLDHIGLDTVHASLTRLAEQTGDAFFEPAGLLRRMCRDGLVGRAAGQGFYSYEGLGDLEAGNGPRSDDGRAHEIRRVGIVGSGTMARGIAEVTACAGLPTVLVARSPLRAYETGAAIEASMVRAVRRGKLAPDAKTLALSLLTCTDDIGALADGDLVIEAVAEDAVLKQTVFAALGTVCAADAVLATTTSSLPVGVCTEPSGRPQRTVGLHFFNPAPVMKLVELVHTPATDADTMATARAFCERLGKTVIDCPDRAGFIVNRLLFPYLSAAVRMLARGDTDIEAVDAAVVHGFGFPMGPFALLDTVGLDVSLAIQRQLHEAFPGPATAPPALLEQAVASGLLGRKNGQGLRT